MTHIGVCSIDTFRLLVQQFVNLGMVIRHDCLMERARQSTFISATRVEVDTHPASSDSRAVILLTLTPRPLGPPADGEASPCPDQPASRAKSTYCSHARCRPASPANAGLIATDTHASCFAR